MQLISALDIFPGGVGGSAQCCGPVVMVVPVVPRPDTNAGDWRVYCLARLLNREAPLTLVPLRSTPGDAVPRAYLARQGLSVAGSIQHPSQLAGVIARANAQTVIFEDYYGVDLRPYVLVFPLVRRVIIDVHELSYLKLLRAARIGVGARRDALALRARTLSVLRVAEILIVISEEEERCLRSLFPNKKIVRIPTCVPVSPLPSLPFEGRASICYPAFFGHHPNIDAAAYFTRSILPRIRQKADIRFDLVGLGSETISRDVVPGAGRRGFVKDMAETLAAYRVMVCPLRYGAGARKKILDAAAAGTPVVSTHSGVEGLRFRNGREILIADTPGAFARAVVSLYQNKDAWNMVSARAHARVKAQYSLETMTAAVSIAVCPLIA